MQRNDFAIKEYVMAEKTVEQYWATPGSGERPKDIRSRPCTFIFKTGVPEDVKAELVATNSCLYRAVYTCRKTCLQVSKQYAKAQDDLPPNPSGASGNRVFLW
jgi:hypothetical protein